MSDMDILVVILHSFIKIVQKSFSRQNVPYIHCFIEKNYHFLFPRYHRTLKSKYKKIGLNFYDIFTQSIYER